MAEKERGWILSFAFTVALFLLIAAATSKGGSDPFGLVMAVVILATLAGLYSLFPKRHLFAIGVTNFLAIYASFYTFFVESNFPLVERWAVLLGFAIPVVTFVGGSWLKRETINRLIAAEEPTEPHHWAKLTGWLLPIAAIGALSFFVEGLGFGAAGETVVFLAMMGAIAAIVLLVSVEVCSFLLQTSLLFEWFFQRMKVLLVPAVSFLIFYTLIVIVFACLYRILDLVSPHNFLIAGEAATISFGDSLYFSMITLSTVGYGDIVPNSPLLQVLVTIQIVSGVLLMLFGFAEFISYGRERAQRRHRDPR